MAFLSITYKDGINAQNTAHLGEVSPRKSVKFGISRSNKAHKNIQRSDRFSDQAQARNTTSNGLFETRSS